MIDGRRSAVLNAARMAPPDISVAIPAYNEAARLPSFVDALVAACEAHPRGPVVQFLVSDDGSRPEQAAVHRETVDRATARLTAARSPHAFTYLSAARNGGKGSAIRRAWGQADAGAAWLAFLDADGAVGAAEFFRVGALTLASGVDVVAGSRVKMAGRTVERDLFRHLQGRIFATVAERRLQLGFYDTQCGMKFFRADLLRPLLPSLREERWLLDLELLARLRTAGARTLEVPIDWAEPGASKVVPGLDAVKMLWGILQLGRRLDRTPYGEQAPEPLPPRTP